LVQSGQPVSIKQLLLQHYRQYGRNFFTRYDYEEVDALQAKLMMEHLGRLMSNEAVEELGANYHVRTFDNFSYTDPIDGSVSSNQGIRIIFTNGSRLIVRLSGTGSAGATIRLYLESYSDDPAVFESDAQQVLKPLVDLALSLCRLQEFTGRKEPTVIT
jgi:phosphoglucomutase